jgi:hypothetical protein
VADWTTTAMVDRMLLYLGRGNGGSMVADELFTLPRCQTLLADAQEQVYGEFMPIAPWAFVSIPWKMSSPDGGRTYEIPGWMYGHAEIYAQESGGRALYGCSYGDRAGDFVFEGSRIRMPGNVPRQFADGPYVRSAWMPGRISDSRAPDLMPDEARELILWKAMVLATGIAAAMIDSAPWEKRYAEAKERWQLLFKTALSAPQAGNARTAWSWQLSLSQFNQNS